MSGSNIQNTSLVVVPLRERAAAAIREAILDGSLLPGSEIMQEEMAERFSISRMPIREAFQILEREELIERKPHRRAIVRSFTSAEITDHYETRAFIEAELAARAARNADAHRAVRAAFEKAAYWSSDDEPTSFNRGSALFHRAIWAAGGSPRLEKIASGLWTGLPIHLPELMPSRVPRSKDEHREICEAILAGDAERARATLARHILGSMPAFFESYNARKGTKHE